jgi:RluA family pseudouridine synthase
LRLTHRIDKDTSGILLIAKNANAASYYTQLFRDHKIQKTYLAITTGTPPELRGVIDEALIKSKDDIEKIEIAHFGRNAVTEYKVLKQEGDFTLFELNPKTGRTHQIRVHLAHIGCPIVGDKKYGGIAHPLKKSMCLHAYKLAFKTKSGKEVEFVTQLPPSFSLIKM